ncbi:uncharacterized protein [Spinacia oleracea]|uniref:Reverse transcriptase zinc-binding domain-containing protein n=1 Tax=Spinacia oleracea TaxID=3562 RepID=A0A9R0K6Z9_SPIOL|nr:uncharacterized protein LOC110799871 [Spinacia oleracea]
MNVCKPKKEGGLGLLNLKLWNVAAMGKHVWMITTKKDNVWVRWVHSVYIRDKNWWDYSPKVSDSWYWKAICQVKDLMKSYISSQQLVAMPKYSIKQAYSSMSTGSENLKWCYAVWGRLNIPKHRFITWLAMLERLNTKEKLMKIGVTPDNWCLICGTDVESHSHLFFRCEYSKQCWSDIAVWLGIHASHYDLVSLIQWTHRKKLSRFKKCVIYCSILSTVYHVWCERNNALWNGQIRVPSTVCKHIKFCVHNRISNILPRNVNPGDHSWFSNLCEG